MPGEYEDDDPEPGQTEDHTFVKTFDPWKHRSALLPPGVQERIQTELNQIEKYLDLTKTTQMSQTDHPLDDDFAKTMKEQQARHVLQTQFMPTKLPPEANTDAWDQRFKTFINSSPLAKIAHLKEENRQ